MTAPYNELEVRLNHTVVWVCMQLRNHVHTHSQWSVASITRRNAI